LFDVLIGSDSFVVIIVLLRPRPAVRLVVLFRSSKSEEPIHFVATVTIVDFNTVEGGEKRQWRRGLKGWAGSQRPVGSGADKNRLDNQPPGGKASVSTEFDKEAAGPERGGGALFGFSSVDRSIDH